MCQAIEAGPAASAARRGIGRLLAAHALALSVHAGIILAAIGFTFHPRADQEAQLRFARGSAAESNEMTVTVWFAPAGASPARQPESPSRLESVSRSNSQAVASPGPVVKLKSVAQDDAAKQPPASLPLVKLESVALEKTTERAADRQADSTPLRLLAMAPAAATEPGKPAPSPVKLEVETAPTDKADSLAQPTEPTAPSSPSDSALTGSLVSSISQESSDRSPQRAAAPPSSSASTPASMPTVASSNTGPMSAKGATAGVANGTGADLVKPRYPSMSVREGEQGAVELEIEVFADGQVGFIRVLRSPGFERLEKAAIDAVRRSRFTPGEREGEPVRTVVRKTILFQLNDR